MTEQNSSKNTSALGDVSMIREIIMGQQISEFNRRFEHLESWIQRNEEQHRLQREALQQAYNARLDQLEQFIQQNVAELNHKMQHLSKNDRQQLADLFIEVSRKLKE
jgi:DNA anti-recombination protein RmuC